jgi:hypothetical protein
MKPEIEYMVFFFPSNLWFQKFGDFFQNFRNYFQIYFKNEKWPKIQYILLP